MSVTSGATSAEAAEDDRPRDQRTNLAPGARRASTAPPSAVRLALLLPSALMLVVGLVGLDRRSMWRDEAATLVAARRSLGELWSMLGQLETVHGLYYLLLHAWLQAGDGAVWARVPSVLAMAVAAGLVGVLGARLASGRVGVVAGLLFVANPSVSFYAQEARSTAMVVAVALLATWLLVRALGHGRARWVAYSVACLLVVMLNLLAVLVPLTHLLTLVWRRSPRRDLVRWAVAGTPSLLAAAALALVTRTQPFQVGWIPRPGVSTVRDFAHLSLGPTPVVMALVALLVLLGSLPAGAHHPVTGAPRRGRLRSVAVPLLLAPSLALVVASLVQPIFVPRYVFPAAAAAALLAAVGVERLGAALGRWSAGPLGARARTWVPVVVAVLAVLAVGLGGVPGQRAERTPDSRTDDLAGAAAVVAAGARPGDGVLFLPDNRRLVALVYPASFAEVHDLAFAEGPVPAGNLTGRPLPPAAVEANLGGTSRVWVLGRPGLTVLPAETAARAELDVLRRDFVPVEVPDAHGVGIALYVRRGATG